jgi:hypothetical protein
MALQMIVIFHYQLFYLLLFNRQIKINIQIINLNVSWAEVFLVEVKKSLDDFGAANLLCAPTLTAEQFFICIVNSHIFFII